MEKTSAIVILALFGMYGEAYADFAMLPAQSATAPEAHASPSFTASLASPIDEPAPARAKPKIEVDLAAKHKKRSGSDTATARGFGSQIPLDFAVRQIVPSTIKVIYGPGADQDALVDWQGGKRWNIVLSNALRPLGLQVRLEPGAVTIGPTEKSN